MSSCFAYSFDRESFKGHFPTREEALRAAERAYLEDPNLPAEAIYVARCERVDPQSSGHADTVLADMRRRFMAAGGDPNWLRRINDQQHADLDESLRKAIEAWLDRHGLWPGGYRFEHISEHPLPAVSAGSH